MLTLLVDVVYAHRPDRQTPIEETVRAFNHVIDQGKAFYWGTSEWNPEEIAAAWRVADKLGLIGPVVEQPQYNLLARERVEKEYANLYEHYGTGLTIFSPLKAGILTGKYDKEIPSDSRLGQSNDGYAKNLKGRYGDSDWQKNLEQGKALEPIAKKLGTDRATLAYAWVLKNPHVSSAITGASKVEQVYAAVKSLNYVPKLTDEIMKEIDDALGNKPTALTARF
jgi:aryl-alcohol dehydrogenase-like predicted oxidoreductase